MGVLHSPSKKARAWIWKRVEENKLWYVACDATPHNEDGSLRAGAAFAIRPDGTLAACTPPDRPGEAMVVVTIPAGEAQAESRSVPPR